MEMQLPFLFFFGKSEMQLLMGFPLVCDKNKKIKNMTWVKVLRNICDQIKHFQLDGFQWTLKVTQVFPPRKGKVLFKQRKIKWFGRVTMSMVSDKRV